MNSSTTTTRVFFLHCFNTRLPTASFLAALLQVFFFFFQENVTLQTRVDDYENERDEFEKQMREFYEREDSNEEVYDYQKQELAKLKHMVSRL